MNSSPFLPVAAILLGSISTLFADSPSPATAQKPLHLRIDRLSGVANSDSPTTGQRCNDAEFLRRIYLDLVGVIPSVEEARAFLEDASPTRRQNLVDRLLADPRHTWHLVDTFDVMLNERRTGNYVTNAEWRNWLHKQFEQNTPLDQIVRTILSADGTDEATRPAAKFLLVRKLDSDLVTRDLGRILLGRDMQCAQCHDHPIVVDYLQRHYFGLSAFVSRSYVFNDKKKKRNIIAEKAEGKTTFASVFTNEKGETGPRILDLPPITEPETEKEPYQVKPSKTAGGVPKYSRRRQLSDAITDPANVAFRQNFANRLWAMMLGRGLVEPLDMHHSENPPTNPKLLDLLADELHHNGYNIRLMIREIALSEVYQRSSKLPENVPMDSLQPMAIAELEPLTPEQLAWSTLEAVGMSATQHTKASEQAKKNKSNAATELRKLLGSQAGVLVKTFAPKSPTAGFDATAEQALFLMNAATSQNWLSPRTGTLVDRLEKTKDVSAMAEELFLSMFSRFPTDEEIRWVAEAIENHPQERLNAIQELVWATMTSAEFRLNH
ncbi:DUF1549 domain-containing protein [Thalassoroseus pseudoceratinae]|uniref:DUF1549 domain-containing protein n=1 Tax=Thalassoroseus pseudoceratinae TaxID=2713176 RepID=UPI001420B9A1|nr:DUF1549 domain-containing protein [Thalassoroseus pseudoceratinae]